MNNKYFKFGLTKTKAEKYLRCSFGYDQYYNKYIRPKYQGSPLIFGVGVDAGLNEILLKTNKDPMQVYKEATSKFELGKMIARKDDLQENLLTNEKRTEMLEFAKKYGYKGNDAVDLFYKLLSKDNLSDKQRIVMDGLSRLSLELKAEVLFKSYKQQVMPKIKEVVSVQKAFKSGIMDLKATLTDGITYVIDNKTSSSYYSKDSTSTSVQLILYAIEEKCDDILYIVIPKKINKRRGYKCLSCGYVDSTKAFKMCRSIISGRRCRGKLQSYWEPYVDIQFVKGKVTDKMKQQTLSIMENIQKGIDNKVFTCNFTQCDSQFGQCCEYKKLFWEGDMEGLEKINFKKK